MCTPFGGSLRCNGVSEFLTFILTVTVVSPLTWVFSRRYNDGREREALESRFWAAKAARRARIRQRMWRARTIAETARFDAEYRVEFMHALVDLSADELWLRRDGDASEPLVRALEALRAAIVRVPDSAIGWSFDQRALARSTELLERMHPPSPPTAVVASEIPRARVADEIGVVHDQRLDETDGELLEEIASAEADREMGV